MRQIGAIKSAETFSDIKNNSTFRRISKATKEIQNARSIHRSDNDNIPRNNGFGNLATFSLATIIKRENKMLTDTESFLTETEYKEIKAHVSFGNSKLPKTTMIFNMGAAHDCPSDALGLCENSKICYAKAAERQYHKTCPSYRRRQESIWKKYSAEQLAEAFLKIIRAKRIKVDAFRFNESGDFWSQDCVDKLSFIAGDLKGDFGIITYGYTARKDLDFFATTFHVLGSNFLLDGEFRTVDHPSGYHPICLGDCKKCTLCQGFDGVIEVVKH